ncbi:MAG: aspartate-semialdehyde dehydrogenase [Bdellovibrionota bacterium]
MSRKINLGVVGATGVVGETFLNLIDERDFPYGEIKLFASENSKGQIKKFMDREITLEVLREGCFDGLDLVFFSSGDEISAEWAPKAVKAGAFAVDNSAAFRMNADFPLVVPEVNGDLLPKPGSPTIIANPNCSTIQLVVALAPLAKKFGLKAVRVASYQSVSGAGRDGIEELLTTTRIALEAEEVTTSKVFPAPIPFNCIPQIGKIGEDGFCTEEIKIMNETNKILRLPDLPVSAFTVRVPTLNSHAEAVWATLGKSDLTLKDVVDSLDQSPGIEVMKADQSPAYPTQKQTSGLDPVFIGRFHRDRSDKSTWMMWVVSDNLRKGAALNGIQIAERIFDLA